MADIFISYERSDRAHAERVAAELERNGWSVWWDRELFAGDAFAQAIQEALNDARCIIVLWSKAAVLSPWVKDEAAEGAKRSILIPLGIDDVEIPLGFRQFHTARLATSGTSPGELEFAELVKAVRHVLERPKEVATSAPLRAVNYRQHSAIGTRLRAIPRSITLIGATVLAALVLAVILFWRGSPEPSTGRSAAEPTALALPQSAVPAAPPTADDKPPDARPTIAGGSGITVSGTGQSLYTVFDASGQKPLATMLTNTEAELFPGTYVLILNGTRQSATVEEGRHTTTRAGRVAVTGSGKALYYVLDSAGDKSFAGALTNSDTELFAGTYVINLNGSRQTVAVEAGGRTILKAGSLVVPGTGQTLFYVFDPTGEKSLAGTLTNDEIELFPGDYRVGLNGTKVLAHVTAAQRTTVGR